VGIKYIFPITPYFFETKSISSIFDLTNFVRMNFH